MKEEMRWGWSMKMNDCFPRHCGEEAVERWQQQTVERSQFTGLTLLPSLECSGVIKAHRSRDLPGPSNPPTSASFADDTTVCLRHCL
ncbi:putative uncharacterized protein encoded by LINC00269 isoform X2 [Hylobates moloch]|uniref:putative uncharacterized protein encoded by LINC00269 isoform X2 n=1 Tax=Hylobates moloch TaxID=81572 RepID=UPI002674B8B4|nr:putative uncharacterized protein encoded by LINC00269 isoform X2 [Hylobates moloch]